MDLEEFLAQSGEQFMANASRNYAQSWAFVHYLKHGDVADKRLIERYLEAVGRGRAPQTAFDNVFGDAGLARLDKGLKRHVLKLR